MQALHDANSKPNASMLACCKACANRCLNTSSSKGCMLNRFLYSCVLFLDKCLHWFIYFYIFENRIDWLIVVKAEIAGSIMHQRAV